MGSLKRMNIFHVRAETSVPRAEKPPFEERPMRFGRTSRAIFDEGFRAGKGKSVCLFSFSLHADFLHEADDLAGENDRKQRVAYAFKRDVGKREKKNDEIT